MNTAPAAHAAADRPSGPNTAPWDRRTVTRSAPTPPARPPKAPAAATRAISDLAVCGSKRSLSNDQNVEMPMAPSTLA